MNCRRASKERPQRTRNNPDEAVSNFILAANAIFEQLSSGSWYDLDFTDNISYRLNDVQTGLQLLLQASNNHSQIILHQIIQAVNEIKVTIDRIMQVQENNHVVPNQHQGVRGRPKFEIPENQLRLLRVWFQLDSSAESSRNFTKYASSGME